MLLQEPTISAGSPSSPRKRYCSSLTQIYLPFILRKRYSAEWRPMLKQLRLLGLDGREVLGVDVVAPEVGVLQIFLRAIAEQPLDVLADEGRRVVAARLEAVDHGRRAFEQR